jgi:hypothetical protein
MTGVMAVGTECDEVPGLVDRNLCFAFATAHALCFHVVHICG